MRKKVWIVLSIIALIVITLTAGVFFAPRLILRALGFTHQGSIEQVLAHAQPQTQTTPQPTGTPAPDAQTLARITGSCPGYASQTFSAEDLHALEMTGYHDPDGSPVYHLVFDEAGLNQFFREQIAIYWEDAPYQNIRFDLREGGAVVYAEVNINQDTGLDLPEGVAYLGVRFTESDPGVQINEVLPLGPADAAGVLPEDIVTHVNGLPVDAEHTLPDMIQAYAVGESVTLHLLRDGEALEVQVELGKWNDDATWPTAGVLVSVQGIQVTPLGLVIDEEVYSLPENGPLADGVADAQSALDFTFGELVVTGPLTGEAHIEQIVAGENTFTVIMR